MPAVQPYIQSQLEKKERIQQIIQTKVDFNAAQQAKKPHSLGDDASFTDCWLPWLPETQPELRRIFIRSVVDDDMSDDLSRQEVINWTPSAVKLNAINVPRDGNCLLHSASVAVWGVDDRKLFLRKLLHTTMQMDCNKSFKIRWQRQRSMDLGYFYDNRHQNYLAVEWDEVCKHTMIGSGSSSAAVPHTFLESVHVYVLANILRRPIIILTPMKARSVAGQSLQENTLGGLYLPLEWAPRDCGKTPIVIGYNNVISHYCPLLPEHVQKNGASHRQNPPMLPLLYSDTSPLPIRYLTEQEEKRAGELLQDYLLVKEFDIWVKGNTYPKVPCVQLLLKPLDVAVNPFIDHLRDCEKRYQELYGYGGGSEGAINNPYYDIHISSQTVVAPASRGRKQTDTHSGLLPATTRKCDSCSHPADPALGNLCEVCFANRTIAETGGQLISFQDGENKYYFLNKECSPAGPVNSSYSVQGMTKIPNTEDRVMPTAPPPSGTYEESMHQPVSMMNEKCINKCGYRCSRSTYPYCHECHVKIQMPPNTQIYFPPNIPGGPTQKPNESLGAGFGISSETTVAKKLPDISPTSEKHPLSPDASSTKASQGSLDSNTFNDTYKKQCGEKDIHTVLSEARSSTQQSSVLGENEFGLGKTKEGFAETNVVANNEDDVIVSREPTGREGNSAGQYVKCASPLCSTEIQPPEKLCPSCKEILLKAHSKPTASEASRANISSAINDQLWKERKLNTSPSRSAPVSKGKKCITASCEYYGDPKMNNMCSTCYYKTEKLENRTRSPPVTNKPITTHTTSSKMVREESGVSCSSPPLIGAYANQTSTLNHSQATRMTATEHTRTTAWVHSQPTTTTKAAYCTSPPGGPISTAYGQPSSLDYNQYRSLPPDASFVFNKRTPLHASGLTAGSAMVTSLTSINPVPAEDKRHNQTAGVQASSESHYNEDPQLYGLLSKVVQSSQTQKKCRNHEQGCQNFANPKNHGLCNQCFSRSGFGTSGQNNDYSSIFGEEVPDCAPQSHPTFLNSV